MGEGDETAPSGRKPAAHGDSFILWAFFYSCFEIEIDVHLKPIDQLHIDQPFNSNPVFHPLDLHKRRIHVIIIGISPRKL